MNDKIAWIKHFKHFEKYSMLEIWKIPLIINLKTGLQINIYDEYHTKCKYKHADILHGKS